MKRRFFQEFSVAILTLLFFTVSLHAGDSQDGIIDILKTCQIVDLSSVHEEELTIEEQTFLVRLEELLDSSPLVETDLLKFFEEYDFEMLNGIIAKSNLKSIKTEPCDNEKQQCHSLHQTIMTFGKGLDIIRDISVPVLLNIKLLSDYYCCDYTALYKLAFCNLSACMMLLPNTYGRGQLGLIALWAYMLYEKTL